MKFQDSANFVGVAWTGSDDSFQAFIDEHGLTFRRSATTPARSSTGSASPTSLRSSW